VSLIGHSQGGMLSRYVAVRRGRLGVVDDIIGFAPSSHGTTNPLAGPAGLFGCTACAQQMAGSAFMKKVNEPPPEAPGPAWYTTVTTTHDEVVTPYRSQALAGDHATNVILQDKCPSDFFEHVTLVGDPVALQWALNALDRPGAANPRFQPDCSGATFGHDPDAASDPSGRPPAPAPPLRARLARKAPKVKRHRALIRLACSGPKGAVCAGRIVLRRSHPKRVYGARDFRVPAGTTRTVRVHIKGRPKAVRARALMLQPGGGVAVSSRRYRLR
jgi:hypothetical protein